MQMDTLIILCNEQKLIGRNHFRGCATNDQRGLFAEKFLFSTAIVSKTSAEC